MADPTITYRGPGQYARKRTEKAALERALAKGVNVEHVPERELFKPAPDESWAEPARMLYLSAQADEASGFWSSGDHMRLWMVCNYYHQLLTDSRGRTPGAQAMESVFQQLTELRLSDRAKRQDSIIVLRGEDEVTEADRIAAKLDEISSRTDDDGTEGKYSL